MKVYKQNEWIKHEKENDFADELMIQLPNAIVNFTNDGCVSVGYAWVSGESELWGVSNENRKKYYIGQVPEVADIVCMARCACKIAEKHGFELIVETYNANEHRNPIDVRISQLKEEQSIEKNGFERGAWVRGYIRVKFHA